MSRCAIYVLRRSTSDCRATAFMNSDAAGAEVLVASTCSAAADAFESLEGHSSGAQSVIDSTPPESLVSFDWFRDLSFGIAITANGFPLEERLLSFLFKICKIQAFAIRIPKLRVHEVMGNNISINYYFEINLFNIL